MGTIECQFLVSCKVKELIKLYLVYIFKTHFPYTSLVLLPYHDKGIPRRDEQRILQAYIQSTYSQQHYPRCEGYLSNPTIANRYLY